MHSQCACHQLLIHPDTLRWRNVLLMVLKFYGKHLKQSDSSWSAVCPLDVVDDMAISLCEDSHSLSFAVSLYMLSIEIAVLL